MKEGMLASTIGWSCINNVCIDSGKLILTRINTKEDKTGNYSNVITIENINNKKFIKDQSGQIIDKAFLFFERA